MSSAFVVTCVSHDNLYTTLTNSANDKLTFYYFVYQKQSLIFHANWLLWRRFAWNVKTCFLGKVRKKCQYVFCWNFLPSILSVNTHLNTRDDLIRWNYISIFIRCYDYEIVIHLFLANLCLTWLLSLLLVIHRIQTEKYHHLWWSSDHISHVAGQHEQKQNHDEMQFSQLVRCLLIVS